MAIELDQVENIRGEGLTFQIVVLNGLNNFQKAYPEAVKSQSPMEMYKIDAMVRNLDAFVAPYYDTVRYRDGSTYWEKTQFFNQKLKEAQNKEERCRVYMAWVREIIRGLGRLSILPSIKVELDFESDALNFKPKREELKDGT